MAHQAWFRYIGGSIDERREHNRVVGWIVHAKRWEVVAAAIGLYAGLVVGFALLYWATGGLSQPDIGSAFYFSVVTQATVGYGDVVATGPGRFLVVGQVLSAVAFIAVVPAIILLRVLAPPRQTLVFSRWAIFDPNVGQFRFRFTNDSALRAIATASVRLPRRVGHVRSPSEVYTKYFHVELEYDDLPPPTPTSRWWSAPGRARPIPTRWTRRTTRSASTPPTWSPALTSDSASTSPTRRRRCTSSSETWT